LFGLGFVLAPGLVLSIYGVETDLSFRYIGQLFGAALVSLAVLAWLLKEASPKARQGGVLALLVGEVLGLILSVIGQLSGALNVLGWSVVVVYLFLSAGLAFFYFKPAAYRPGALPCYRTQAGRQVKQAPVVWENPIPGDKGLFRTKQQYRKDDR
jgi:hypothetical protein